MSHQKKLLLMLLVKLLIGIPSSSTDKGINFLTISDMHLNNEQKHIMEFDPLGFDQNNDMDLQSLFKISYSIKKNIGPGKLISSPLDFVLYLGDGVGHQRSWELNRTKLVEETEHIVFTTLQEAFPNTPIISIFGNNDSFEKDYGKFIFKDMSTYNMANQSGFKNGFLSSGTRCDNIMPYSFPCIFSQNQVYGFFSVKIQTNLLLIGLNTVMFSPYYNAKPHEIKVQMEYLKTHLELARASGISVLIAMHIPVGKNVYDGTTFWKKSYQDTFLKLIRTYHNQIKGLLVSHTHMEEFKIIKVPSGQDIGEFFTAGLSTSHGNSPSVKVFQLKNHEEDWEIQNYITYQIHEKNDEIVISKFYDFLSTYCAEFPSNIRSINSCLSQITFNQTLPRFTVNNPNFQQNITSPEAFYVN